MNTLKAYNISKMPKNEAGATLIVVLLFLVLISIAGVISVKRSSLDLRVATSDQISTVLLQSADSVNSKIEESANAPKTSEQYNLLFEQKTGMFSHFISDLSNSEHVINFCFLPKDVSFNVRDSELRLPSGGTLYNSDIGFCNPERADNYTSSRSTTMTQVTLDQVPTDEAFDGSGDFQDVVTGISSDEDYARRTQYDVFTTSILPAYGSARSDEVRNCLSSSDPTLPTSDSNSLLSCLANQDIASKMLVERVEVGYLQRSDFCALYGGVAVNPRPAIC